MRFSFRLVGPVLSLLLLPALAAAEDGGVDGGPEDAGLEDAGTPEDAAVPDASAGDETSERCLDGYDRSYVTACDGKTVGAACTFRGGEVGQCAALRCLDAAGSPLAICVATTGMPAPPPVLRDAGLASDDPDSSTADDEAGGGGCSMAGASGVSALPWLALVVGLRRARRGAAR